jgi:hypothetical protein
MVSGALDSSDGGLADTMKRRLRNVGDGTQGSIQVISPIGTSNISTDNP